MTNYLVAKRYARALLEIGKEDGQMEAYGQDLQQMVALFDATPELEQVLANPAFDFQSRRAVLDRVLEKGGLSPMVLNFFRLLMERRRISAVREITTVYGQLLDQEKGITRAEIKSATALGDAEVKDLAEALKKMAGGEVVVEVEEDPSLIGGVVARIGDLVLDGSVRTQLRSLKDSLRRGEVV